MIDSVIKITACFRSNYYSYFSPFSPFYPSHFSYFPFSLCFFLTLCFRSYLPFLFFVNSLSIPPDTFPLLSTLLSTDPYFLTFLLHFLYCLPFLCLLLLLSLPLLSFSRYSSYPTFPLSYLISIPPTTLFTPVTLFPFLCPLLLLHLSVPSSFSYGGPKITRARLADR